MIRRLATAVAAALAAGAGLLPASASATDGNLYLQGSSIWATSSQFTGTVLPGPVWQVGAPAPSPALALNQLEKK